MANKEMDQSDGGLSEAIGESPKSEKSVIFKIFLIGLISGIAILTTIAFSITPPSNDEYSKVTIKDFASHSETDFTLERTKEGLKPKDRWMLDYIVPPPGVDSEDVYVFDCETVDRKPESLTNSCADFGVAVWKIKWSRWSANVAEGSGIFRANNCEPSCAEGSFLRFRLMFI